MSSDQKSAEENHSNSSSSVVAYDSLFLVRGSYQNSCRYQHHFVEYNDDNRITLKPSTNKSLPFPLESLDGCWQVSSSCNGLIFMFSAFTKHGMVVCNPCTREYVNLVPYLSNTTSCGKNNQGYYTFKTFVAAHGFGYHPHTKEYKIVIITYNVYCSGGGLRQTSRTEYTPGQVMVYTLGSGRWRSKGKFRNLRTQDISEMILHVTGVLVNGVLHWILEKSGKEIVLFDLEDEEFRVVLAPPSPPGTYSCTYSDSSVGLYAGCLCVTRSKSSNYKSRSLDIWVTKNKEQRTKNKEHSWILEFSIPLNHEEKRYCDHFLGCLKGGKILLRNMSYYCLVSYYPETDSFEKNEGSTDDFKWSSCLPYKKTFVSLKALGEKATKYVSI